MSVDVSAFDLAPDSRMATLCLHGFTGTPYEMRSLGESLAQRGVRALAPVLPGHNQTPRDLAQIRCDDWLEAARENLRALRAAHSRVGVAGMSMGGVLSLLLAAQEPVDAIVSIGAPLRLARSISWSVPVVKYLWPYLRKGVSDIRDPEARARHPAFPAIPLAAVHELIRLQARLDGELHRVSAPLLIAHGAHDHTANPADAHEICERVASDQKEVMVFEGSAHVVTVDFDRAELARRATEFLVHELSATD
ncbi:alpha/beta fold hydrolase [Myxococcota bacterium]|nr:alpha/beta fold hydrolase [Myxococcota bacterium]